MKLVFAAGITLMLSVTAVSAAEPPPAATVAGSHPLKGRIWQPAEGRWLTPEQLVAMTLNAGIVALGEIHDNPDSHALQSWMVRRLGAAGRRPVTAFEMIDTDRQATLDAARSDLTGLGDAVEWDKRGWPAWTLYRPIAEATVAAGGDLRAANLPAALTRQISRNAEPAEIAERFGLDVPLSPADAKAMTDEIRDSHCNLLPEAVIPAMVRVQRARDAAMAEVVADQAARPEISPVVLIAGAGHARADRGVPTRLRMLVPGVTVLSIAFLEVEADETNPAAYAEGLGAKTLPFDAVWFTGRAEREDPCAQMERHVKKKDGK